MEKSDQDQQLWVEAERRYPVVGDLLEQTIALAKQSAWFQGAQFGMKINDEKLVS